MGYSRCEKFTRNSNKNNTLVQSAPLQWIPHFMPHLTQRSIRTLLISGWWNKSYDHRFCTLKYHIIWTTDCKTYLPRMDSVKQISFALGSKRNRNLCKASKAVVMKSTYLSRTCPMKYFDDAEKSIYVDKEIEQLRKQKALKSTDFDTSVNEKSIWINVYSWYHKN